MKKLAIAFGLVLAVYFYSVDAQVPAGGGGRPGGGLNVTGAYTFNARQFSQVNTTNITLATGAPVTNLLNYGNTTNFGTTEFQGAATTRILNSEIWVTSASHITNVVWSNNMVVNIVDTNEIKTFISEPSQAPIMLEAKTNITIRGLGWDRSVIWSGSTGTLVSVSHCENITFENLTIEGTRTTENMTNLHGASVAFAAVWLKGTNSHIKFLQCKFINHFNHGIVQFSQQFPKNSSYVTVEDCWFENIAATNNIGCCGLGDGTAVNILGPNQIVRNNTFTNCALGIEFEGSVANPIKNILIEGNLFLGMHKEGINSLGSVGEDDYTDIIIRGNVFDYNTTTYWPTWAYGIRLALGKRVLIEGNLFNGGEYAIAIQPQLNAEQWIVRNNITRGITGQCLAIQEQLGAMLHGVIVDNNQFNDCGARGIRVVGGRYIDIRNNQFNKLGNASYGIELIPSGGTIASNRIVGNLIYKTGATAHSYGIVIGTGALATLIKDNNLSGHSTAGWSDSGTGSDFRNNIVNGSYINGYVTNTAGSGDVTAASTFGTDNVVIRADGTGKGVQSSAVSIEDNGDISGIADLGMSGSLIAGGNALIVGDIETTAGITAATGITNSGPYIGTGAANGQARLVGTGTGFFEFIAPTDGNSNSIVPTLTSLRLGDILKVGIVTTQAGTNSANLTNIGISPFTNSYTGPNVFIPSDALAKEVQVLVATNDFLLLWTNQVSGKLISLSIYNNTATNIAISHHGGVRFMGGVSNVVAAGRELSIAAKFIGTNISLAFAPQTN